MLALLGCDATQVADPAEEQAEIGSPGTAGTSYDTSSPEPTSLPFAITVTQSNSVNATAGSATEANQQSAPASVRAVGSEHSECEPSYGRKSDSSAKADLHNLIIANDGARFTISSSVAVQGGHYRTYIHFPIHCTTVYKGRDSTGAAKARAEAIVQIKFNSDALVRRYDLSLTSSSSGDPPSFTVQGAGAVARSVLADGSSVNVEGGPNKIIFVRASLETSASHDGGSGHGDQAKSSAVDLTFQPAPLAYADTQTPFIINGEEAMPGQYPAVVAIGLTARGSQQRKLHCSGTLIAPSTILTAAHCIKTYGQRILRGEMAATVGKFFSNPDEGPIRISGYAYPNSSTGRPSFDSVSLRDDIGLLYLSAPFKSIKGFAARHLGSPGWPKLQSEGKSLTLVGYGLQRNESGGLTDDGVKRYVTIPFNGLSETTVSYTFQSAGGGACRGDSGGASYLTQARLLAAVTSSGKRNCQGDGIQTRVDAYRSWLEPRMK